MELVSFINLAIHIWPTVSSVSGWSKVDNICPHHWIIGVDCCFCLPRRRRGQSQVLKWFLGQKGYFWRLKLFPECLLVELKESLGNWLPREEKL